MVSERTPQPERAASYGHDRGFLSLRLSRSAIRHGMAGAVGGFLVFLLLEGMGRAAGLQDSGISDSDYDAWRVNVFAVGITFGVVVTALLAGSAEWWSGSRARILSSA